MAFGARKPAGGPGGRGKAAAAGDKAGGQRRGLFRRRKVCKFCADRIDDINYKDVKLLSGFVPERAASPAPVRSTSVRCASRFFAPGSSRCCRMRRTSRSHRWKSFFVTM